MERKPKILLAVMAVISLSCFLMTWALHIESAPASAPPLGTGPITVRPIANGTGWPAGARPTGAWSGPPEILSGPHRLGEQHGNTLYYWKVRGMRGIVPAERGTMILCTDDWRWESTYQRSSDTIERRAADGRRFRRKGTPEYSVVAIMAPSVVKQAAGVPGPVARLLLPNDAGTLEWRVDETSWIADHGPVALPSGGELDATAEPHYNSAASGHSWQTTNPGPTIVSETEVANTTFTLTVPGFSDDLRRQSVFVYPAVPPTPDATITLLEGVGLVKDVTVSYGGAPRTFRNGYNQIKMPAGGGSMITVNPEVPPTIIQYAILYVPGDTWEIPDKVEDPGGK